MFRERTRGDSVNEDAHAQSIQSGEAPTLAPCSRYNIYRGCRGVCVYCVYACSQACVSTSMLKYYRGGGSGGERLASPSTSYKWFGAEAGRPKDRMMAWRLWTDVQGVRGGVLSMNSNLWMKVENPSLPSTTTFGGSACARRSFPINIRVKAAPALCDARRDRCLKGSQWCTLRRALIAKLSLARHPNNIMLVATVARPRTRMFRAFVRNYYNW